MSKNSYLNLTINSLPFKITKAIIHESLEELFNIECEGFFESLDENLITSSKNINFHPNVLIDQEALFSINNPYENKTLNFDINEVKEYQGIVTYVNYEGINQESSFNINNTSSKTNTITHKHFFKFKIQSVLIRLSLNKANRIYTQTNVIEIIKQTLDFYQGLLNKEIDFSNIHLNYEDKELISQYNESDLDFITRLAHNNGIFFYEDKDKIYFCDAYAKSSTKNIKYNPNVNNTLNETCISSIFKEQSLRTNVFTHSSVNAKTPLNLLSLSSSQVPYEKDLNHQAYYNEHSYESEYSFTQSIDLKTPSTQKEKRAKTLNESFLAKSNIYYLSLADHINLDYNAYIHHQGQEELLKDFMIVANTQILIDDAILANSINTNDHLQLKDLNLSKSYSNTLTLLKSDILFTPSLKAKPKAPYNTQGIVIGEDNDIESKRNTIYTDEYGRVKVRINLYANQEELDEKESLYHHSAFLRVASSIASNHSGFYHTPRIGDEVIVSFLDDDIDKPYVSGSLYNGTTSMPQYNYPRYKREIVYNTLEALKDIPEKIEQGLLLDPLKIQEDTDYKLNYINDHYVTLANATIGIDNLDAKARNEITLKNDKDKEEIYILAQRDYKIEVGNNYNQTIKKDKISEVGGKHTEFITLGHMQNIVGFKNVNVRGRYLENTSCCKKTNVRRSNFLNVEVNQEVKIHKNSYEKVGENKEVKIGRNYEERITGEYTSSTSSNRKVITTGYHHTQSQGKYSVYTDSELVTEAKGNIQGYTEKSILMVAKKDHIVNAENVSFLAQKDNTIVAYKKIVNQVKTTSITTTAKEVIIQVGGVQVIIDSKGLRVKGGDLRVD
ncbi:type VI secretion system Vgr family protein [Campylobacter aviculae]|uniref:Type VI secretion protein VgrG n=1 Tax=Campylobacter aviculae TaxID=2510190 RepID=A0A4U7BPY4_9BACT|nr:type VI secretion system tip protein VgrG [Campylobacter aviculae]TKX32365.1 type VI secretion protein VgrG [Campylobacter aviculae]